MPAVLESPALYRGDTELPAFEVKFLLSEQAAKEVQERLSPRLALDPHADPALGNAYRITSVYFDTPNFDVYRRSDGFRRRKFRVRRYGSSPTAFLERKSKRQKQVRKRRTTLPLTELGSLANPPAEEWEGAWFVRQLTRRGLRPVCRVAYERIALIGTSDDGPIRATFDRAAFGEPADGPDPHHVHSGRPLLSDGVITEFKFLGAMPSLFKSMVEDLRLVPSSVSKYRRCVEAVGLFASGGGADA
jgi:hypothetical protein